MPWPSTIGSFSNPNPTDPLNSPSHSGIETAQNTAILEIERSVGTDAAVLGTIIGDLRNPVSAGGGHVQGAAYGGTGQTTFGKGDILVAQSASVLSKLTVGVDGTLLQADSSISVGVKWSSGSPFGKIHASILGSVMTQNVVSEGSIFSVIIPGSTLGTNNAVRATLNVRAWGNGSGAGSTLLAAQYGNNQVASILVSLLPMSINDEFSGQFVYTLIGGGATNIQRANLFMNVARVNPGGNSSIVARLAWGNGSVLSDASAKIGMTIRRSEPDPGNGQGFYPDTVIVERIT